MKFSGIVWAAVILTLIASAGICGESPVARLKLGPTDQAAARKLARLEKELAAQQKRVGMVEKRADEAIAEMAAAHDSLMGLRAKQAAVWAEVGLGQWKASAKGSPLSKLYWKVLVERPETTGERMIVVVVDLYGVVDPEKEQNPPERLRQIATVIMTELRRVVIAFDIGVALITGGDKDREVKKNIDWSVLAYGYISKREKFVELGGLKRVMEQRKATEKARWPLRARPWWEKMEKK